MSFYDNLRQRVLASTGGYYALVLAVVMTTMLMLAGLTAAIEQSSKSAISSLQRKSASGDFVIVELDAKSLNAIGQWPWPRQMHAQLIDKLSQNNAAQIAFDVDFSAQSNPASDAALADAIDRSNSTVILATFKQLSVDGGAEFSENLPRPEFAQNAILASVNVTPNDAGQIANYGYGETTGHVVRPSLAALLTGASGDLSHSFEIDQAVDPATIPRLSAVDVLNGKVDPALVSGKNMLIGATAIELGDRYATPNHGVIPGVVIHAMAIETLVQGMNIEALDGFWPYLLVVALVATMAYFWHGKKGRQAYARTGALVAVFVALGAKYGAYWTGTINIEIGLTVAFLLSYWAIDLIVSTYQTLAHERSSDASTELPNGQAMLQRAQKMPAARVAVAQIGNFTEITAICSAEELVAIVQSIARRLQMLALDGRVYRTGTDQIAWFVDAQYEGRLQDHFDTAASFMLQPVEGGDRTLKLQVHCGYMEGESNAALELLSKASIAAHNATKHGYRWIAYSDDINDIANEKLTILSDVDAAIREQHIWVAYQPKMDVASNRIESAEALARWQHPVLGNIGPDRFIPLLEAEGRMAELTLHILRQSLSDMALWNSMGKAINVSVNISAALLLDSEFVELCVAAVVDSGVEASQVTFEITETSALSKLEEAAAVTRRFRDMGIRISIDDYGTGQSTLSYLRNFSAHEIKIDQSFVKSMNANDVDRVMVGSTINLAHEMDLKVVAEGVEDAATLATLAEFGCDVVQGWHIGRPVDATVFAERWVALPKLSAARA